MLFKDYKSKPITRQAHKISISDVINKIDESTYEWVTQNGSLTFKAYEAIEVGDYIVKLDDEDIYHCRSSVFKDRNIVD